MCIYIYIYIQREREREPQDHPLPHSGAASTLVQAKPRRLGFRPAPRAPPLPGTLRLAWPIQKSPILNRVSLICCMLCIVICVNSPILNLRVGMRERRNKDPAKASGPKHN